MDALATALLELDWSDMDEFAQHLHDVTIGNDEIEDAEKDPRFIAQILIDWAHDNKAT